MKKIGMITFHASHNCGSILQTYALQTTLKQKYKKDPEVINFYNQGSKNMYSFYIKNDSLKSVIKNILYFLNFKVLRRKYFQYDNYINQHINITKETYHTLEELKQAHLENKYDAFICGSDQIWNITCKDADDAYFLPFVKNKLKIAYAPSLGARNIVEYADDVEKYKKYLKDISYLSVREFNGKKWLEDLTQREVKVLPDPTLLLNPKDYEKIETPIEHKEDYIFYYSYSYSKEITDIVLKFAKMMKLKVIVLNGKKWVDYKMFLKNVKVPRYEEPGVFLSLMKNAKLVLTTSFHGAVFASLYKKNFWVIKSGEMQGKDDRVYTLLKQLGLLDRFLPLESKIDENLLKEMDYSGYDQKLEDLRENAYNFLDEALSEGEK